MRAHAYMCMGQPPAHFDRGHPTSTQHHPPRGGDPWNQSEFNENLINQDILIQFAYATPSPPPPKWGTPKYIAMLWKFNEQRYWNYVWIFMIYRQPPPICRWMGRWVNGWFSGLMGDSGHITKYWINVDVIQQHLNPYIFKSGKSQK